MGQDLVIVSIKLANGKGTKWKMGRLYKIWKIECLTGNHNIDSILTKYDKIKNQNKYWICFKNGQSQYLLACSYGELVGDGMCNDEANNEECLYDGGDCCSGCINTDLCSECLCYEESAILLESSCMYFFHLTSLYKDFVLLYYVSKHFRCIFLKTCKYTI